MLVNRSLLNDVEIGLKILKERASAVKSKCHRFDVVRNCFTHRTLVFTFFFIAGAILLHVPL